LDTIQHTSKAGQLCKVYHYFSGEYDVNGQSEVLCISDTFLGNYKVGGQTTAALSKQIMQNTVGQFWKLFNTGT
jgi:hypothetical protein